jgi:uncharacterized protein involved in exopolysaccharide biosynthesis
MECVFNASSQSNAGSALQPTDYIRLLRTHVYWWAVPAVVFAIVAGAYTFVAPREWKATQALIIRPEVASVSEERLGRFSDLSEMKTSQETVLELAKSQVVVQAALRDVGPPSGYRRPTEWPTALDVEAFREHVDMRPPGGAEFGKTEVFYLSVGDSNRARASDLVVALCNQLEHRMRELRGQSAQGMISELERTVAMAAGDLSKQTEKLSIFEASIGADLAELRNLNADSAPQGEVSQERQAIASERRANESRQNESERLLKLLVAAQRDPQQLLATPNTLLVSQPSVSQLKNSLVNAQVHTAELLGSLSEKHPFVIAAREAENRIRNQLNNEVAVAIRGLEVDIQLCADRERSLAEKSIAARERMSHLAEARAEYANLVASVQNHTRLVEAARKNLADARARQAGANGGSLISRIDGVETGVRPVGPSRRTVAAAGGIGGLLLGFGLVFLFASSRPIIVAKSPCVPNSIAIPPHATIEPATVPAPVPASVASYASVEDIEISPTRRVSEAFGMFRGMSLQEAARSVQRRNK